jgi:hypothetical protein
MLSNIRAINKHFIEKSTFYCLNHTPMQVYFSQLLVNIVKNVESMPINIHVLSVDVAVEIPSGTCDVFVSIKFAFSSLGCCELYHHQFLCLTFLGVPFDFSGLLSYFPS